MMMNSHFIPHALIERVPLFVHSDNDTDAFTAKSFRECICIPDMELFSPLCTRIQLLKTRFELFTLFLESTRMRCLWRNKQKWKTSAPCGFVGIHPNALDWPIDLSNPRWVPLRIKRCSNCALTHSVSIALWGIRENERDDWKLNNICNFSSTKLFFLPSPHDTF